MEFDVARVRGLYVSLSDGWTYLNAHDCPQIPERVSASVARSFRLSTAVADVEASTGSHSRAQRPGRLEGASFIDAARFAVADLVGAGPERVVLGPSLEVLYLSLAHAMRPLLRSTSSVVLSHLDPPVLSEPFTGLGSVVRWAQPDLGTGELPGWQYHDLVDGSTRLVALSAAHELLGTLAPVTEITEITRSRSRAWVLVDASAYAPYRLVNVDEWDADIVAVDVGKLGGPPLAALVFRDPAMFRRLASLNPAVDARASTAAKLETPVAAALAGGVPATVDHLSDLVETTGPRPTRRHRLEHSMTQLASYLDDLSEDLYTYLSTLPAVHILGVTGEAAAGGPAERLPRLSFAVRGVPAETVHQRLFDNGLITTITPMTRLLTEMGVEEIGGAVTVSLSPFNNRHDVEHFIRVVASLA